MKYRLTIHPALEAGNPSVSFGFETYNEMEASYNTSADLLLFMQDEAKVMKDYSNMFIKEYLFDNDDWQEIDEDPERIFDEVLT